MVAHSCPLGPKVNFTSATNQPLASSFDQSLTNYAMRGQSKPNGSMCAPDLTARGPQEISGLVEARTSGISTASQQTQSIWITFVQCWTNVENVGPTLYTCYTNMLRLLGWSARQVLPANTGHRSTAGLMLVQHRRWCTNVNPA